MNVNVISGYGADVTDIFPDDFDKLKKLIEYAPEFESSTKEVLDSIQCSGDDFVDHLDELAEYTSRPGFGIASILAEVIEEAENLSLIACTDSKSRIYLLYDVQYPWASEDPDELYFTSSMINGILENYIAIFTDTQIHCDYVKIFDLD